MILTDGNSKIFAGVDFLEHVSVDGIPSVDRLTLAENSYHHTFLDGRPSAIYSPIELRSFCRICVSLLFRIGRNNRQSSANSLASDSVDSGRSLINSKKSKGPITVPCGTPDSTSEVVDLWPSSCTSCVRWLRKSWIHKKVLFRFP